MCNRHSYDADYIIQIHESKNRYYASVKKLKGFIIRYV